MNSCAKRVPCSCRNIRGPFLRLLIRIACSSRNISHPSSYQGVRQVFLQEHSRLSPRSRCSGRNVRVRCGTRSRHRVTWPDLPDRCSSSNIRPMLHCRRKLATKCSCRNTCGSVMQPLQCSPPSRGDCGCRLRSAEVFLQEHLSPSNPTSRYNFRH